MQTQREFLKDIIEHLQGSGIDYMISGSLGSSFYGEPRATNDIDIVIDPVSDKLDKFLASLSANYYVSKTAAIQALHDRSMFNVIDKENGWEIDLIVKKSRPFSAIEFTRKQKSQILGLTAYILSSEDSIISKLEWATKADSLTQLRDAMGILINLWDKLDFEYLNKWADQLGISEDLKKLIAEVQTIRDRKE
jgi:hypothetical protein